MRPNCVQPKVLALISLFLPCVEPFHLLRRTSPRLQLKRRHLIYTLCYILPLTASISWNVAKVDCDYIHSDLLAGLGNGSLVSSLRLLPTIAFFLGY